MSDFIRNSEYYGLKMNEFIDLPKGVKKKLRKFMARISEKSYRRGVQQALELKKRGTLLKKIENNIEEYRFKRSLDFSFGLDGYKTTSKERLEMEVNLGQVGL